MNTSNHSKLITNLSFKSQVQHHHVNETKEIPKNTSKVEIKKEEILITKNIADKDESTLKKVDKKEKIESQPNKFDKENSLNNKIEKLEPRSNILENDFPIKKIESETNNVIKHNNDHIKNKHDSQLTKPHKVNRIIPNGPISSDFPNLLEKNAKVRKINFIPNLNNIKKRNMRILNGPIGIGNNEQSRLINMVNNNSVVLENLIKKTKNLKFNTHINRNS